MDKLDFLLNNYAQILKTIPRETAPEFGKMNVHQMIEHMEWAVKIANGKIEFPCELAPELVTKMHRFMMSDQPFRDNTPNSNLPDEPLAPMTDSIEKAIEQLQTELVFFKERYEKEEGLEIINPFFGSLNFEEQTHLLHKHAHHHLRQFGITV